MDLAIIAKLIAEVGIPAAHQIYIWVKEGRKELSESDWEVLLTLGKYRSDDALTAAGIKIVDGKVVPLNP